MGIYQVTVILVLALKISTLRGSSVPSCRINPSQQLIVTAGEPSTLTCIVSAVCQNLTGANAYFYSPDAQNVSLRSNVVNDNMLDEILVVKNRTNDPYNCSYPMDVNWTHNEQIRSKLSSIQCAFIFEDGASNCITDKINIVFADSHCDNRTKITPSDVLHVPKGESTTVSCSSPCILNGSRITNVFFISPSDGRPIVGRVNFTESDEVCIYSMEIKDSGTRTKLDSLYCDFTYSSIYLESCKTAVILVKSSDTDAHPDESRISSHRSWTGNVFLLCTNIIIFIFLLSYLQ